MLSFSCNLNVSCCRRRAPVDTTTSPEPEPEAAPEETDDFEVISVSSVGTPDSSLVEARLPSPSELADPATRLYVVWRFRDQGISWPGIHYGPARAAYDGLTRLNGRSFGGLKWKRVYSRRRAEQLFAEEAAKYGVATAPINFYAWARAP